jgi:hypothetical protein
MAAAFYQQHHPQSTILYFLVESLDEKVKAVWEQRFERYFQWIIRSPSTPRMNKVSSDWLDT